MAVQAFFDQSWPLLAGAVVGFIVTYLFEHRIDTRLRRGELAARVRTALR